MSGQHVKPHFGVVQARAGPMTTQHSLGPRPAEWTRRVGRRYLVVKIYIQALYWSATRLFPSRTATQRVSGLDASII